jgi:hypothetical protein
MSENNKIVSNVTGEVWEKHRLARWQSVINHTAVVVEEMTSAGKNDQVHTLPVGSKVLIDDIRGRIKPQYRCTDETGKIWFIPIQQLEILNPAKDYNQEEAFSYRGGVRTDAQQPNAKYMDGEKI